MTTLEDVLRALDSQAVTLRAETQQAIQQVARSNTEAVDSLKAQVTAAMQKTVETQAELLRRTDTLANALESLNLKI